MTLFFQSLGIWVILWALIPLHLNKVTMDVCVCAWADWKTKQWKQMKSRNFREMLCMPVTFLIAALYISGAFDQSRCLMEKLRQNDGIALKKHCWVSEEPRLLWDGRLH